MTIYNKRMTVELDGPIVVFLLGMRINKPWKVHKWWPVARAMPRMLKELHNAPESGFLSGESWFGRSPMMLQYWKSFEALENYAQDRNQAHLPAWKEFNLRVGASGDVGIWHESFVVTPGHYECIYFNMPKFGMGKFGRFIEATGKLAGAKGRRQNLGS